MAPSIKNRTPKGIINPTNWLSRMPSTTDATEDFYQKNSSSFHGFVVSAGAYIDQNGNNQTITGGAYNSTNTIILAVGPYNEVTIQVLGGGTVTVKGALYSDPNGANLVSCNTVSSADGFTRIQSLYKFISISGSGLSSTGSIYLQIW